LNSVNNILNENTKHSESVVHSLLQHMKFPLHEFRIHGDGSAEFFEAQLDWNVFTTQLECVYHLQGKERRNVLTRNNLVKCRKVGSRGMVRSRSTMKLNELCCTYARLAVCWTAAGCDTVARCTVYLRTARGAGCAVARPCGRGPAPDNGPLAPVR
jgi:hypothetical protein